MVSHNFEEFITQNTAIVPPVINWGERKSKWLEYLEKFYSRIDNYLKPYGDKVVIVSQICPLYEEQLGQYEAEEKTITVGEKKATLTPVGSILIGAFGRVDLEGKNGSVKFVLVPEDKKHPEVSSQVSISIGNEMVLSAQKESPKIDIDKLEWKIATPPPKIKYINLTEESFLNALMEVMSA